jgi:(p)ppGpp synthase/HD superfamily hydrolase
LRRICQRNYKIQQDGEIKTTNIEWKRLAEATAFALEIHDEQMRKGTDVPYISHLLGVTSLVLEHGGSEDAAITALLHDAVEDQGAHQAVIIKARFGASVEAIVVGCTDADILPKPPWRARKATYIRHLEAASADALLVSCVDKLHNARSICTDIRTHGLNVFDRFKGSRAGTLWYYKSLAEVFKRLLPTPISRDLHDAVQLMGTLSESRVPAGTGEIES